MENRKIVLDEARLSGILTLGNHSQHKSGQTEQNADGDQVLDLPKPL